MSRGVRSRVMLGIGLLAACQALAQEELAARVEKAQDAARANAASPQGREWLQRNSAATGRLMIPVLNRCLPEPAGDIPTVFAVYVRLSQKGGVREVVEDAVRRLVKTRRPLFEFKIRRELAGHDLETVEGRVAALRASAPARKRPTRRPGRPA